MRLAGLADSVVRAGGPAAAQAARPGGGRIARLDGRQLVRDQDGVASEEHWTSPPAAGSSACTRTCATAGCQASSSCASTVDPAGKVCYVSSPGGAPPTSFCAVEIGDRAGGVREPPARLPAAHPLLARRRRKAPRPHRRPAPGSGNLRGVDLEPPHPVARAVRDRRSLLLGQRPLQGTVTLHCELSPLSKPSAKNGARPRA